MRMRDLALGGSVEGGLLLVRARAECGVELLHLLLLAVEEGRALSLELGDTSTKTL